MFLGACLMAIGIKILDSVKTIEKKVNALLSNELNTLLTSNKTKFEARAKEFVKTCILEQPEIASLKAGGVGSLAAQVGIPAGREDSIVESIIMSIVNATRVNIRKFDIKLKGRLEINFQPADFVNLVSMQQGIVHTEKGDSLDWLSWLLKEGAKPIIIGYQYQAQAGGRSRGGIMEKGTSWRIPPQFAGTETDNFITRAFSDREKEIQDLFAKLLGA